MCMNLIVFKFTTKKYFGNQLKDVNLFTGYQLFIKYVRKVLGHYEIMGAIVNGK